MSDSTHSAAVINEPAALLPYPESLGHSANGHGSTEANVLAPTPAPATHSLHPNGATDSVILETKPLDANGAKMNGELHAEADPEADADVDADADADADADGDNDSEAETLISSPVKKREALRNAKEFHGHMKTEKSNNASNEAKATSPVTGNSHVESRDGAGRAERPESVRKDAERVGEIDGGDSDNLSDVLSLPSSSRDSETKDLLRSPASDDDGNDDGRSEEEESQSEVEGESKSGRDSIDRNGETSNPRKRKLRESYMHASMEPPRRRRRASDDAHAHTSGENGDSPSPQLRRHRRTASTQSNWTDAQRSGSATNGTTGPASGRQRRAATHFPVREPKTARNNWDSDTSSEASHQHHLSRLTRNINRSVSTPGRPMGRDHKRHVNKYGFTRLAEACENGDLDLVKEWREKDPEQLEQREFAGNTPLQVASLNGYPEIVSYLLEEKCNPHTANTDQDTPLIDAVENGHIEVVRLLLEAGVNPLRQNLKGQQALDLVTEETENAQEIRSILREAIEEWKNNDQGQQQQREGEVTKRPGPSKELHFLAYTASNLLRLAGENDRSGIIELLQSQVEVNNEIVAAAAKTGDTFTVSMLLAEIKPREAKKKPELPLLAVIGTSHFEMVKYLTGADRFNPTWRSRSNGMTWYELAESRQGPNWRQEKDLLKQLYDDRTKTSKLSSSPVSRRENGKRRRSLAKQADSDMDMEDLDSNGQARSRRRLVSKKVMRESSNRRRSFSSSESGHEDDQHMSKEGSKVGSPTNGTLKPPPPRKVGRPRKTSSSARLSEARPKRRRSPSTREHSAPSDTPRIGRTAGPPEGDEHTQHDKKIKIEDPDRQRDDRPEPVPIASEPDADIKAAQDIEASREAELQAKIEADKLAEVQLQAERARKEEEEARRKDAERIAEEIRLQHQRRMAEERRVKEENQIKALPSALRHVLGLTSASKSEKQKYIQCHFLPVQVVKRAEIGSMVECEGKADELWMLSYQAAAILTNVGAADLLDLPADPLVKRSAMAGIAKLETTVEQRRAMLPCLQSASLVHALQPDKEDGLPSDDDLMAEFMMAEKARLQIAEDRAKLLAMSPLRWIRFSDFYNAATASGSADYPHISGLDIDIRFDCCLNPTPFAADVVAENCKTLLNGVKPDDAAQSMPSVNGVLGKHDIGPVQRTGPGITTFTIVQD